MTRYSVYLATVVVLSNSIGPTFEPETVPRYPRSLAVRRCRQSNP